jgi:replicative superfamily II helicase
LVDFKRRLSGKVVTKPADPSDIYQNLDRAHDKGPLRPAQEDVLTTWFSTLQATKDVIVKLHTGQGKTLIGLLMLQSRLNQGLGPAVYLCPDNYLIEQTCEQAKQFGVKTCNADGDLPETFLNGTSILVTSVQKMFNGRTKFGLNRTSIPVGAVLMDDCHICSDRIRDACRIRIPKEEPAYAELRSLFSTDLEAQGVGTYAEVENGMRDAILPVPYWAIPGREADIAKILAANIERKSIKFAWPLLKDMLSHCQYMISGEAIEIEPYLAPLEAFGSFYNAEQRIFMSATVTDDSFLIKGLQLQPETIASPLVYVSHPGR